MTLDHNITMEETVNRKIGRQVRFYRKRMGMSVEVLADRVGVASTQIVRLELGQTGTSLSRLKRIADVLGVHMRDLMPPDDKPSEDFLELAFRGSGLTVEETQKVLEYARMLRMSRQHDHYERKRDREDE